MRQFHLAYSDVSFLGQAVPETGRGSSATASAITSTTLELLTAVPWGQRVEDHFVDITDMIHMGSTELAANLFRATQAEEKLRRESITGKDKANRTHREVGA